MEDNFFSQKEYVGVALIIRYVSRRFST